MEMLKERKVWWTIKELERKTGKSPLGKALVVHEVMLKNKRALWLLTFKNEEDVNRTIDSLVSQRHAYHDDIQVRDQSGHVVTGWMPAVKTEASADSFYRGTRFWKKWIDEVGVILILGAIATILSFVPNGVAYKALEVIELTIEKLL